MAVTHDTETRFPTTDGTTGVNSVDTTTGDRTFSHAGSASATGAVVFVFCTGTTRVLTGVLYGGVAMYAIVSADDTSEAGRVECFVLTEGVPTGTQTVTIQGCTATAKWATCSTVTSTRDVGMVGARRKDTTTAANPSVVLDTGTTSVVYGGVHSGAAAPATSGLTGYTIQKSNDYGALVANAFRSTDPIAAGTFSPGVTLASDDYSIAACALGELAVFPTTGVLDSFNRANGALGANWTVEPFNEADDAFTIVSNAAQTAGAISSGNASWWNLTTYTDSEAWIDLPTGSSGFFEAAVYLRLAQPSGAASTGDGYQVFITGTGEAAPGEAYDVDLSIFRWDNAVQTEVGATQTALTFITGNGLGARIIGTTIQAYTGTGAAWVPFGSSRTDATYTASGFIGMALFESARNATINNFGGGAYSGRGFPSRRPSARPRVAATGSFN